MKLLTKDIQKQLIANDKRYIETPVPDNAKVPVRFFGGGSADWHIISGTPIEGSPFADHDELSDGKDWMLFGIADLGPGFPPPELGGVWLGELKKLKYEQGILRGLPVIERDKYYEGTWKEVKESKGLNW